MSSFENLVHYDPTLTDIEKFNHLISCLSDEALGTVNAFQVTEENYHKAMASFKKVYDNDCLIFMDNISKLFEKILSNREERRIINSAGNSSINLRGLQTVVEKNVSRTTV